MAEAARGLITAAGKIDYGFLPENHPEEEAFLEAFLQGAGFRFISPYYVAANREDARLLEIMGLDCIRNLTEIEYDNGPPSNFTGPFYLYKVKPLQDASDEYPAVLIFGGASVPQVMGMSFAERVERAQSAGLFYILDQEGRCEPLLTWSIPGRGEREFVTRYTPRLVGVGYYEGAFLVYDLASFNTLVDDGQTYSFRWLFSKKPPTERRWQFESYGSAALSEFSATFDPFAVVNLREPSR